MRKISIQIKDNEEQTHIGLSPEVIKGLGLGRLAEYKKVNIDKIKQIRAQIAEKVRMHA